jgi:hypothetical protein
VPLALGYSAWQKPGTVDAHTDLSFGGGEMYSSAADLFRIQRAILTGTILSPALVAKLFTPSFAVCPPGCPPFATALAYAAGWETGTANGQHLAVVEANVGGFFHAEEYFPASRTTVIVLANLSVTPSRFLGKIQTAIFG